MAFGLWKSKREARTAAEKETIQDNWRCFVACGIMLLAPFQYGLDFGLIGGLQAMVGFLKVSFWPSILTKTANCHSVRPLLTCCHRRFLDTLLRISPVAGTSSTRASN
jgi:hypothetical protein